MQLGQFRKPSVLQRLPTEDLSEYFDDDYHVKLTQKGTWEMQNVGTINNLSFLSSKSDDEYYSEDEEHDQIVINQGANDQRSVEAALHFATMASKLGILKSRERAPSFLTTRLSSRNEDRKKDTHYTQRELEAEANGVESRYPKVSPE